MVCPWLAKRRVCPHGNYEHLTTVPFEIAENEGSVPLRENEKTRGLSLSGGGIIPYFDSEGILVYYAP